MTLLHFVWAAIAVADARPLPFESIRWPEGTQVLPFDNLEGMMLVTARLDGPSRDTTGSLVIDTGAGYLALDHELAARIGITDRADGPEIGLATRPLTRLRLGSLERDQVSPVLTIDAGIVRRVLDRPVLGLLGHQPLRDRAVWIDYRHERAALIPSEPVEDERADPVALSRAALGDALSGAAVGLGVDLAGDGKILVRVRLSDPVAPRFSPWLTWIVDTGSSKCVLFEPSLSLTRSRGRRWPMLDGLVAPTLMGAARTRLVRVPLIEVASAEAPDGHAAPDRDRAPHRAREVDMAIVASDLSRVLSQVAGTRVDGLLGYSVFEGHRVVIDYPRRVLWLDRLPGTVDERPFEHSHVGIQLERDGARARVVAVASRSPAAIAGVRVGDQLVRVDGAAAGAVDVITLARRLEGPPGSSVTLVLRRGEVERTLRLRRRRLL